MSKTYKYYVVWVGRETGIFSSWVECEKQVKGYPGARYKGFYTLQEAEAANKMSYEEFSKNGLKENTEFPALW